MTRIRLLTLLAVTALAPCVLSAQAPTEASMTKEYQGLRDLPDTTRPAATEKLAIEIRTLPDGAGKLKLANFVSHVATEGDPGQEALNAVAETLALALKGNPMPPKTPDAPPASPYLELAKLIRYEHVTASLDDPEMVRANAALDARDAEIQKANFTLKDLHDKKETLSDLRGKIVLVNFWATWCQPCRREMPDLDAIYTHYQSQGLVILSISQEDAAKVSPYIESVNYHPLVLLDPGGVASKAFHVDGIPKSFVFDREGKLVAESIDMRTQRQFFKMLSAAGLKPAQ